MITPVHNNLFDFCTVTNIIIIIGDMVVRGSYCHVHRLYVPAVRLNYGKRSLYNRGTIIWNSLPISITEMNSLNSFKLAYLSHI